MTESIVLVALLNFVVDFLLLLGTNRLCGYPPGAGRAALASVLGGIYSGACLLPGFHFLGSFLWRTVFLGLIIWFAFGAVKSAVRRGAIFALLCMALGGAASGMGGGSILSLILAMLSIAVVCILGFWGKTVGTVYLPVELSYGEKCMQITALQDTGNMLRDPVTGQSVLIVGRDVAQELTSLTAEQLKKPLETMSSGALPGLRLIPYHAIGNHSGMLLALRIPEVKIGNRKGSRIVAFAPDGLCTDGAYQALTGGVI